MKKHVGVLEQAGLVTTEKVGRVRSTCRLGVPAGGRGRVDRRLSPLWAARFDALDAVIEELKRKGGPVDARK